VLRTRLRLAPELPDRLRPMRLENVPPAGARLTITVDDGVRAGGLPDGVHLHGPEDVTVV
jgi:hypothetical protein